MGYRRNSYGFMAVLFAAQFAIVRLAFLLFIAIILFSL